MEYNESTVRKISHVCYVIGIWVSIALAIFIAFRVASWACMPKEKQYTSHLYGDKHSVSENIYDGVEALVESNKGGFPVDFYFATNSAVKNTEKSYGILLTYDNTTHNYTVSLEKMAWTAYCDDVTFKDSDLMEEYLESLVDGKDPVSAYKTICDFNNNNGFSELWDTTVKFLGIFDTILLFVLILLFYALIYILFYDFFSYEDGLLIPMIIMYIPCVAITGIYSLITKRIDKKAEQKSKEEKFEDNYTSESDSQDNSDNTAWYHKIVSAFSVDCGNSVRSLIESMKQLNSYYEDVSEDSSHSFYNIYCKELYSTLTSIREQFQRGTISMKEEIIAIEKTCSLYHDIFVSLFERIKERDRMSSDNYEISNEAMRKYAQSMGHLDSDEISQKNSSENT